MSFERADVVGVTGTPMTDGIYEVVGYLEPGVCELTNDFADSSIFVLEERIHLICKCADRVDMGDEHAS
jgi:hypothetical protein